MRENFKPPRGPRAALAERERKTMEKARSVRSTCVRPVLVAGDVVVVRWVFEFEWRDGTATRMEELAWQRWDRELETVAAARLLGAEVLLVGISTRTALTMVHLGLDLAGVTTRTTMAKGLELAFERLGLQVVARERRPMDAASLNGG